MLIICRIAVLDVLYVEIGVEHSVGEKSSLQHASLSGGALANAVS